MLDSYLAIATHPFLYIFLGFIALMFAVQWATGLEVPKGFSRTQWLQENYVRIILGAVAVLFVAAMAFYLVEVSLSVTALVDLLREELRAQNDNKPENLRNLAYAMATLVAVLAGSATIFFSSIRVWINERNTKATEQGLITDRINSAVEGLGAEKTVKKDRIDTTVPNIEVRIGAVLALERIAKENLDFHIQIMQLLCAYVRLNAPLDHDFHLTQPRLDIQIVISILGRRTKQGRVYETKQKFRLDLSQCLLSYVNFEDGNFLGVNLSNSNLTGSSFQCGSFHGARLIGCILDKALFWDADFTGADFSDVTLVDTISLNELGHANLLGASLIGADLSGCDYLGKPLQTNNLFGSSDTILSEHLSEVLIEDEEKNFKAWSLYSSREIKTRERWRKHLADLGLVGFPYQDSD